MKTKMTLRKAAKMSLEVLLEEHTEDCKDKQGDAIRALRTILRRK